MENWADFATLAVGTDGALTAQWFQKPEGPDARDAIDALNDLIARRFDEEQ